MASTVVGLEHSRTWMNMLPITDRVAMLILLFIAMEIRKGRISSPS